MGARPWKLNSSANKLPQVIPLRVVGPLTKVRKVSGEEGGGTGSDVGLRGELGGMYIHNKYVLYQSGHMIRAHDKPAIV